MEVGSFLGNQELLMKDGEGRLGGSGVVNGNEYVGVFLVVVERILSGVVLDPDVEAGRKEGLRSLVDEIFTRICIWTLDGGLAAEVEVLVVLLYGEVYKKQGQTISKGHIVYSPPWPLMLNIVPLWALTALTVLFLQHIPHPPMWDITIQPRYGADDPVRHNRTANEGAIHQARGKCACKSRERVYCGLLKMDQCMGGGKLAIMWCVNYGRRSSRGFVEQSERVEGFGSLESPPSIWSLGTLTGLSEILKQGTGCVKGRGGGVPGAAETMACWRCCGGGGGSGPTPVDSSRRIPSGPATSSRQYRGMHGEQGVLVGRRRCQGASLGFGGAAGGRPAASASGVPKCGASGHGT
ncbi:hypothetical protein NC652_040402 [Populus alba x Populus x berolinensis]|nr:hypothetical protein NC652_040402 [Populus alba x Populus x berolinensis]